MESSASATWMIRAPSGISLAHQALGNGLSPVGRAAGAVRPREEVVGALLCGLRTSCGVGGCPLEIGAAAAGVACLLHRALERVLLPRRDRTDHGGHGVVGAING